MVGPAHRPCMRQTDFQTAVNVRAKKRILLANYFSRLKITRWNIVEATAPYFYGSILLRALKSKIIVILTYV